MRCISAALAGTAPRILDNTSYLAGTQARATELFIRKCMDEDAYNIRHARTRLLRAPELFATYIIYISLLRADHVVRAAALAYSPIHSQATAAEAPSKFTRIIFFFSHYILYTLFLCLIQHPSYRSIILSLLFMYLRARLPAQTCSAELYIFILLL